MKKELIEIYKIFFLIGLQLLGGGYVIVPLLKKYIVDERQWMSEEELVDFFAMCQCIPGIIAGNIATCAGYKAKGFFGALAAVLGLISPSFIIILAMANILTNIISYDVVQNAFWGIRISVIILIILTIKEIWAKSLNSKFAYIIFFSVLACLLIYGISPTIIIIASAIVAILYNKIKEINNV